MSFFLVRLEPDAKGQMVDVPLPDYGPYEKGSEASRVAKLLTEQYGQKVQPRRMTQAGDWRQRITKRFEDGTYRSLPAKWDIAPIKDHFAHLSDYNPGTICFFESEEMGAIDRITAITPGRYLTRYYETEGKLDDAVRRRLIAAVDPSGEIHYAKTPEEIARIYIEGPESCMDGRHREFASYPCWPTAPYGAGDLAVAYTMNNKGRIQSRVVCWPEKKLFGRLYGAEEKMRQQMENEGYESLRTQDEDGDEYSDEKFVGARILKVPMARSDSSKDYKHMYVLPYFDDIAVLIDNGDHFITANDRSGLDDADHPDVIYGGGSQGYGVLNSWCPKQQGYCQKTSFVFVHGANEEWSRDAISYHAFTCARTNEVWTREFRVRLFDGDVVSKKWFEENGATCPKSGAFISKTDLVDYNGTMVSRWWAADQRYAEERKARLREEEERRREWARNSRPNSEELVRVMMDGRVYSERHRSFADEVRRARAEYEIPYQRATYIDRPIVVQLEEDAVDSTDFILDPLPHRAA